MLALNWYSFPSIPWCCPQRWPPCASRPGPPYRDHLLIPAACPPPHRRVPGPPLLLASLLRGPAPVPVLVPVLRSAAAAPRPGAQDQLLLGQCSSTGTWCPAWQRGLGGMSGAASTAGGGSRPTPTSWPVSTTWAGSRRCAACTTPSSASATGDLLLRQLLAQRGGRHRMCRESYPWRGATGGCGPTPPSSRAECLREWDFRRYGLQGDAWPVPLWRLHEEREQHQRTGQHPPQEHPLIIEHLLHFSQVDKDSQVTVPASGAGAGGCGGLHHNVPVPQNGDHHACRPGQRSWRLRESQLLPPTASAPPSPAGGGASVTAWPWSLPTPQAPRCRLPRARPLLQDLRERERHREDSEDSHRLTLLTDLYNRYSVRYITYSKRYNKVISF